MRAVAVPTDRAVAVVAKKSVLVLWVSGVTREPIDATRRVARKLFSLLGSAPVAMVKRQKLWMGFATAFALPAICFEHVAANLCSVGDVARLTCGKLLWGLWSASLVVAWLAVGVVTTTRASDKLSFWLRQFAGRASFHVDAQVSEPGVQSDAEHPDACKALDGM